MSDRPRNILKIKTSGLSQQNADGSSSAVPQSAAASTPKIKLTAKARPSEPSTQASESAATPKTTLKFKLPKKPQSETSPATAATKKRDQEEASGGTIKVGEPGKKKLKLTLVKKRPVSRADEPQSAAITTPFVRFKVREKWKKRAKIRQKGYAYDSEASDREDEPVQQWNFILRMPPGEDAEWIRSVIEKRELEKNKQFLKLRFLQEDGRRAMLTVKNKTYAAILVDLPCIIESMKGWDKKGWYKSADIHQMLLVLGTITVEAEALKYPVPKTEVNEKTWAYAHGLTPPMHWVRKRRFRKRISTHAIQDIEAAVARLLEKDAAAAGGVTFEILDRETLRRQEEKEAEGSYFDEDGMEEDYEYEYEPEAYDMEVDQEEEEVDEEAFQAQFESFMAGNEESAHVQGTAQTPGSSSAAAVENPNGTDSEMGTPAAAGSKATSDDEDDEDDDDDEDESEKEERVGFQRAREEISELEAAIKEQMAEMQRVGNPLLKARIRNKMQALQADLELKKAAIGDEDDDDDD